MGRGFRAVVRYADAVAQGLLFAMMAVIISDVLLRKITGQSILGTVEITELMLVGVVFGALARCETGDGHIRIDLAMKGASPRLRAAVDAVTQLVCGVLFGTMTCALVRHAGNMRRWGEVTLDLGLPVYPFVYAAGAGCGLLAVVLLMKSFTALRTALRR